MTAVLAVVAISSAAPAAAETGVSSGKTYSVTVSSIQGAMTDRLGTWDAKIVELSGGDPAVVEAFNHSSRIAAQEQIEKVKTESNPGEQWNFESNGQVAFRSIAVAQLILGTHYYGAHPTSYTSTVVIDSRSADPIMLADLFTDGQAGLAAAVRTDRGRAAGRELRELDPHRRGFGDPFRPLPIRNRAARDQDGALGSAVRSSCAGDDRNHAILTQYRMSLCSNGGYGVDTHRRPCCPRTEASPASHRSPRPGSSASAPTRRRACAGARRSASRRPRRGCPPGGASLRAPTIGTTVPSRARSHASEIAAELVSSSSAMAATASMTTNSRTSRRLRQPVAVQS